MRKISTLLFICSILLTQSACHSSNKKNKELEAKAQKDQIPVIVESQDGYERAYRMDV